MVNMVMVVTTKIKVLHEVVSKDKGANPSLGRTIRDIKPKNFETHLTSRQHRTHLEKAFHLNFHIKRLSESCKINCHIPNEWRKGKKRRK